MVPALISPDSDASGFTSKQVYPRTVLRHSFCAVLFSCLLPACGGNNGPAAAAGGLLDQTPHCESSGHAIRVQGTIDGVPIDNSGAEGASVILVNIDSPKFDTPSSSLREPASNPIELHLTWQSSLAYGETGPLTGDYLVPAKTHPRAGEHLCVRTGEVGFVNGGSEDGVFKFRVTGARPGADCSADVAVDLRGCYHWR